MGLAKQKAILLAVIVLFLVAGFFIYQHFQLSGKSTTTEWKTYLNSSCGNFPSPMPFSVKIPQDWTETIQGGKDKDFTSYVYQSKNTNVTITCGSGFGGGGCGVLYPEVQNEFLIDGKEVSGCMESNQTNKIVTLRLTYLIFDTTKPGFSFEASTVDTPENRNLINQILLSFKYLGQNVAVSSDKAIEIVGNIPEVKTYLSQTKNAVVGIDEVDSTDKIGQYKSLSRFSTTTQPFIGIRWIR